MSAAVNVLVGKICPDCGSQGPFLMDTLTIAEVSDDGIDYEAAAAVGRDGRHEIKGNFVECCSCGHSGKLSDFNVSGQTTPKYAVEIELSAFDIARLGKDEIYNVASDVIYKTYEVELDVTDMKMLPMCLDDEFVTYQCVPMEYTVVSDDEPENNDDSVFMTGEPLDDTEYTNFYECPCGTAWEDVHDCQSNDRCPNCNKEIEPYKSEEL